MYQGLLSVFTGSRIGPTLVGRSELCSLVNFTGRRYFRDAFETLSSFMQVSNC